MVGDALVNSGCSLATSRSVTRYTFKWNINAKDILLAFNLRWIKDEEVWKFRHKLLIENEARVVTSGLGWPDNPTTFMYRNQPWNNKYENLELFSLSARLLTDKLEATVLSATN